MATREAAAAQQVFENEAFNQQLEKRARYWGGEEGEVQPLEEEHRATAQELLTEYYFVLKDKFDQGEELTPAEIAAGKLAQKVPDTPKAQAQLYAALEHLALELDTSDELAKKMGFVDGTGALNEKAIAFSQQIDSVQREVVLNLTGFNAEFDYGQYEGKFRMADQIVQEQIAAHGLGRGLVRGYQEWAKVKIKDAFSREDEFKKEFDQRVEDYKDSLFGQRVGEFKVEKRMDEIASVALEQTRQQMLNYLENRVRKNMGGTGYPDDNAANHHEVDYWGTEIKIARTTADLENAISVAQQGLEAMNAQNPADLLESYYKKQKPEKRAEELVFEEMMAPDLDEMARNALRRELPQSEASLNSMISNLERSIKAEQKRGSRADRDKIEDDEARIKLAQEALAVVTGNKIDELLKKDHNDVDAMGRTLPKEYKPVLEEFLAAQYGLPSKDQISANADFTKRKAEMNKRLNGETRFSVAMLILMFMSEMLRR